VTVLPSTIRARKSERLSGESHCYRKRDTN